MNWLTGKRTYIVAAGIGIVAALKAAGVIDEATANVILTLLGGAGLATVRAAVK